MVATIQGIGDGMQLPSKNNSKPYIPGYPRAGRYSTFYPGTLPGYPLVASGYPGGKMAKTNPKKPVLHPLWEGWRHASVPASGGFLANEKSCLHPSTAVCLIIVNSTTSR